jgi:hypothetical protein
VTYGLRNRAGGTPGSISGGLSQKLLEASDSDRAEQRQPCLLDMPFAHRVAADAALALYLRTLADVMAVASPGPHEWSCDAGDFPGRRVPLPK